MDEDIEEFENAVTPAATVLVKTDNISGERALAENTLEVATSSEEAEGAIDYLEYLDECAAEKKFGPFRFACIGSREITPEMQEVMESIGEEIVAAGHFIASGNALGSDIAYARGGNRVDPTHVIIYLPWASYNKEFLVEGNHVTTIVKPQWKEVAKIHHPVYDKLSRGAQGMMDRNAGILSKADKCIAFLNKNKSGGGGTGHGWRIAGAMGIPRFDLSSFDVRSEEENMELSNFLKKPLTNK